MRVFGPCVDASGGGGVLDKTGLVQRPEADSVAAFAQHKQRFSLSVVGVVALAPTPAVQLDVDARRLAIASGAEEAAPRAGFGSLHPRTVGVGF